MTKILKRALSKIEEEAEDYDKSFALVDKLIAEYGEKNLASRLYEQIDKSYDWLTIANLFSILEWSTSDNGHELCRETKGWLLEANDERKIKIAMNLTSYPFLHFADMEMALNIVSKKFPNLKHECEEIVKKRRKLGA